MYRAATATTADDLLLPRDFAAGIGSAKTAAQRIRLKPRFSRTAVYAEIAEM